MFPALPQRVAPAALLLTLLAGCGGSDSVAPSGGNSLASVSLTPGSATLYTAGPGNTQLLTAKPLDDRGTALTSGVTVSFTSDAPAIATVNSDGVVTALTAGTAHISASAASGSTTKTASATVTVIAAPTSATVTAPAQAFNPSTVDVAAGGSVTWNIANVPHNVIFDGAGGPADVAQLQNASASRSFTTSGSFAYHCSLHSGMRGTVRVH